MSKIAIPRGEKLSKLLAMEPKMVPQWSKRVLKLSALCVLALELMDSTAMAAFSCESALTGKIELSVTEKIQYLREGKRHLPNSDYGLQIMDWIQDPYQPFAVRKEIFNMDKEISLIRAVEINFPHFTTIEKIETIKELMRTELPAFNFDYHILLQVWTMDSTLPLLLRYETFEKLLSIRKELDVPAMVNSFFASEKNKAIEIFIHRNSLETLESYNFEKNLIGFITDFDVKVSLRQVLLARYITRFEDSWRIPKNSFSADEWKSVLNWLIQQQRPQMTVKATQAVDDLQARINAKPFWSGWFQGQ